MDRQKWNGDVVGDRCRIKKEDNNDDDEEEEEEDDDDDNGEGGEEGDEKLDNQINRIQIIDRYNRWIDVMKRQLDRRMDT